MRSDGTLDPSFNQAVGLYLLMWALVVGFFCVGTWDVQAQLRTCRALQAEQDLLPSSSRRPPHFRLGSRHPRLHLPQLYDVGDLEDGR